MNFKTHETPDRREVSHYGYGVQQLNRKGVEIKKVEYYLLFGNFPEKLALAQYNMCHRFHSILSIGNSSKLSEVISPSCIKHEQSPLDKRDALCFPCVVQIADARTSSLIL